MHYVVDADGGFDWAGPDEEVHAFFNELARPIGTQLYGRRMYEVMSYWESSRATDDESPAMRAFGVLWRASDKIVLGLTRLRSGCSADGPGSAGWRRG